MLIIPVLWSPAVYKSEVVLEYEKPTPAGDSRNSKFATVKNKKLSETQMWMMDIEYKKTILKLKKRKVPGQFFTYDCSKSKDW